MFVNMTSEIVRGVAPEEIEDFAGMAVSGAWGVRVGGKIVAACGAAPIADDGREWLFLDVGKDAPKFAVTRMAVLYLRSLAKKGLDIVTVRDEEIDGSARLLEWLGFRLSEKTEEGEVWKWQL